MSDQREGHPGVVATIRERTDGFAYEVREPSMTPTEWSDFDVILVVGFAGSS